MEQRGGEGGSGKRLHLAPSFSNVTSQRASPSVSSPAQGGISSLISVKAAVPGRGLPGCRMFTLPVMRLLWRAIAWLALASAAQAASAPPFPDLFPSATRYEAEAEAGPPPVMAAYRDQELLGWVFSSHETVGSSGYSGRPLDILIGLDRQGRLTGARMLSEEEPIFAAAATRRGLERFLAEYRGLSVERPLEVRRGGGAEAIQAVSGATISSLVINDAVLRAARTVARAKGCSVVPAASTGKASPPRTGQRSWPTARSSARRVSQGEVAALLAREQLRPDEAAGGDPERLFVELFLALASPPQIGRNLAGSRAFVEATAGLGPDDHLVFVGATGRYSVKGTAWVRTGSFDRVALVQGDRTIRFAKEDHIRLDELAATGAPELREAAFFVIRAASGFRPAEPWRLQLLIPGRDAGGGSGHAVLEVGYRLPGPLCEGAAAPPTVAAWRQVWLDRAPDWRSWPVLWVCSPACSSSRISWHAAGGCGVACASPFSPSRWSGSAGTPAPSSPSSMCSPSATRCAWVSVGTSSCSSP